MELLRRGEGLHLLLIGTVFSSFLIPVVVILFYFSDSFLRRRPVFLLTVSGVLLGLVEGAVTIHTFVSHLSQVTQHSLIVFLLICLEYLCSGFESDSTNITHSPYCILIIRVVGASLRPVNPSVSGYFWMLFSASLSQGESRPLYPNGIPEGRSSTDCRHLAVPPAQRFRGKVGVKHDVCAGPMGPTTSR